MAMLPTLAVMCLLRGAAGDSYLNNPRGSNNKLSEQSNNVQNANRLFDSQNNAASGYQIGDNCKPVCQDANRDYDATKAGAMEGMMTYYQGSELYIEWYAQHGCGQDHPNLRCQVILQYMSETDNPGLRDGTKRGNDNNAGGQKDPPVAEDAKDPTLGQHEPLPFYLACRTRERNKGLYTADQLVSNDRGATATRQNPNGNANAGQRHGLECPEERDYYPYWHPSPWHDIAVLSDEEQVRCGYYRAESQNVKAKGYCSELAFNNPQACTAGGGTWKEQAPFGEDPPECAGGIRSRDNHNGNVRNGMPMYYVWRIPEQLSGRAVLRLRYNITTTDFEAGATINQEGGGVASEQRKIKDPFFIDETFNDRDPSQRRRTTFRGGTPILSTDPQADFLNLGGTNASSRVLQLQVNTNQLARTFEDRTHAFAVRPRPADVSAATRIVNYNVRGRRGNIVQVYPSVEYDFVPPDLTVEEGTFLHFQWVGSDANAKGNAGNGRQGTDRSNLVQVATRGENVPLPIERQTLFFDAQGDPGDPVGRRLVDKFAYLEQDTIVTCDPKATDNEATNNCKQLNGASAYFDGGLVEMTQVGSHHVASTRNNDFSNRSQKATITVLRLTWPWYGVLLMVLGSLLFLALATYLGAALYAFMRPSSTLFSRRYRPRILRLLVPKATLERKIQLRRAHTQAERERLIVALASMADPSTAGKPMELAEASKALEQKTFWARCSERCGLCGLKEQRMVMFGYGILNLIVFVIGVVSNLDGGFRGSAAYPLAKGGGYTLDLNCAVIVLPTLKSLQTALRGAGATREWIPIDDPISFHIGVAGFILLGTVVHVAAHVAHMTTIRGAPVLQQDPLRLWELTAEEMVSGTPAWAQVWNVHNLCAPFTGALITVLMLAMGLTALPCARRGTNRVTRRLGGFNLFWRVHTSWKLIYVLLLLHAPARIWIWLLFPAVCVAVDRVLLANRQRPYAVLRTAKRLPRDVISLTFEIPAGFTYEAGQYVLLGWRGEWHPFTLTSAPEEQCLSVHIRAPDALDWCSALRRRLLVEAPAAAAEAAAAAAGQDAKPPAEAGRPPAVIEYAAKTCMHTHVVYCQPVLPNRAPQVPAAAPEATAGSEGAEAEVPKAWHETIMGGGSPFGSFWPRRSPEAPAAVPPEQEGGPPPPQQQQAAAKEAEGGGKVPDIERGNSLDTILSSQAVERLPKDAVVMQLSGPFGAPAQKVWHFETIMAVGAGIGVTPFASILRSVQLRAKQRKAIQGMLAGQLHHGDDVGPTASMGTRASIEQLLRFVVTVPRRIYFFWIVRSQDELDWFYDLLAEAVDGPARDNVHITVFLTGEVELKQVRELRCTQSQYFGRPNWGRIFKQTRDAHKGQHIGVFLCGSPVIGQELARESAKYTDAPSVPGGTRFSFFKEHF